jgi:predicted small secreted protein
MGGTMKLVIALLVLGSLTACSTPRVLVQNCEDAGPWLKNCELVKKL